MENHIGKVCPFCKTEIGEGENIKVCSACGIPHHENCWNENHGCTTFGCSEQHYEAQHTNPTDICTNCGGPLGDGQAFCPKCGTPKTATKNICSKCGNELQDGQEFCPKCGQKAGLALDNNLNAAINQFNSNIDKKSKKNKAIPIIIAVVVALAAIFGFVGNEIAKEKKAEEMRIAVETYIEDAKNFYATTLSYGSTMEDIGNEIQTAWKAYVNSSYYKGKKYYSVDSAVAAAQSTKSSSISSVKGASGEIEALYKKLLTVPDTSNQELLEIKSVIKNVYDAYQDMYDCVISPSGSYNSWTSEFSDVDSELADAIGDLATLVY